jgi:hypothetical protein
VDHEDRVSRVEDIDDLQKSPPLSLTLDQELVIADLLRKRWLGLPNNSFRFFRIHAMLGNVISVPVNPSKLHDLLLPAIVAGEEAPGKEKTAM